MGPRKKSRPNPIPEQALKAEHDQPKAAESKAVTPGKSGNLDQPEPQDGDKNPPTQRNTEDVSTTQIDAPPKPLNSKGSWYGSVGKKSWPSLNKTTAITQVARESILADKPKNESPSSSSVDLSRFEQPKKVEDTKKSEKMPTLRRPPSMLLGKSRETSSISVPIVEEQVDKPKPLTQSETTEVNDGTADKKDPKIDENSEPKATETGPSRTASVKSAVTQTVAPATGWLEWIGIYGSGEQAQPTTDLATEIAPAAIPLPDDESSEDQEPSKQSASESNTPEQATSGRSWFSLWSSTAGPGSTEMVNDQKNDQVPVSISPEETAKPAEEAPKDSKTPKLSEDVKPAGQPPAGSSWAFWSREDTGKPVSTGETPKEPLGELAVAGEESQTSPEPAKATSQPAPTTKKGSKSKPGKRGRALVSESEDHKSPTTPDVSAKPTPTGSPAPSSKTIPSNLLLPSFDTTYRLVENPSIIEQIRRLLMQSHQPPAKHLHLVKDPPRIKRALAIGVHGLFPAPLLRTVIGQPTGTSIRFAENGSQAIRRFIEAHGYECEIEKVALEGEGKIGDRVDNLWKLLLNWIDHVREADFIFFCCHSQGVPVSIMLIAKLIDFGVVSSARIGVCAMAGVSLGPFADYKSRLFSGSAGELFDFANPESAVSTRYVEALRVALQYGTRITYCGSIDDQLVSMESSTFATVNHPYIYRAVFIDGRIHAADFITHLVGFALKLRNLGISDHGLIRELSAPLAGSLYGGEGHSRLYDDGNVYDMAIRHALETTTIPDTPLQVQSYTVPTNSNPYILPWSMRGLLEEDFVKTELQSEATQLLEQFDKWKPTTKVLKDVKFRLEAVRSKL